MFQLFEISNLSKQNKSVYCSSLKEDSLNTDQKIAISFNLPEL